MVGPDHLPLIQKDGTLNLPLALGIFNFFNYAFQDENEDVGLAYYGLPARLRPRKWDRPLKRGIDGLGKRWLGVSGIV